jgi:rhodanese-related sulfurtransferase
MTGSMVQSVTADELKKWIHDDLELALLDIREHGQYGEDHLFFAVPLPYSSLELHVGRLVPKKSTRTVLVANEGGAAIVSAAAQALFRLGYTQVFALQSGIESWKRAGFGTFAGVNLPSKTFGEIAEHAYGIPKLSAIELHTMLQDKDADLVVLDGRPIEEYRKMNIPGSICCPNGELALRIHELAPNPETTVVVNCAGRTRSIIGAQSLISLNIPNKVYALENGTQGWFLADLSLEHHSNRLYPQNIPEDSKRLLRQRADQLTEKFDLSIVDAAQVQSWLADESRNTFLCDIRTPEEVAISLPAGAQHTPGGQLIQATDQYIGVRKSRIVLCDFDDIRAPVVASWLKQLGWNVFLLKNPQDFSARNVQPLENIASHLKHTITLEPARLSQFIHETPSLVILDARSSIDYRKGHLKGAVWTIRPNLINQVSELPPSTPLLLMGSSIGKLQLLAQDLERRGADHLYICLIKASMLEQTGLPMEQTPDSPGNKECIDYLFFVHDRHDGNKAAAKRYLEWETNLVSQLDQQERATFLVQP